jgi:hypothetical protein
MHSITTSNTSSEWTYLTTNVPMEYSTPRMRPSVSERMYRAAEWILDVIGEDTDMCKQHHGIRDSDHRRDQVPLNSINSDALSCSFSSESDFMDPFWYKPDRESHEAKRTKLAVPAEVPEELEWNRQANIALDTVNETFKPTISSIQRDTPAGYAELNEIVRDGISTSSIYCPKTDPVAPQGHGTGDVRFLGADDTTECSRKYDNEIMKNPCDGSGMQDKLRDSCRKG